MNKQHILFTTSILLLLLLYLPFSLLAQEGEKKEIEVREKTEKSIQPSSERKLEIGLNVTTVISSFLANNSDQLTNFTFGQAGYPVSLKLGNNKKALRLAFGVNINRSNIFQTGFDEIQERSFISAKVGGEKRLAIGKRWLFFYGFDVITFYEKLSSTVNTSIDRVRITQNGFGGGVGPVYGLQFHLNHRMSLGCEGSLYTVVSFNSQRETFSNNPFFNQAENSTNFNASTEVPKWLYFIVRL